MGMLATSGTTDVSGALTDAGSALTSAIGVITNNGILFALFGCSLLIAGFKVFKRAKNAAK